MAKLDGLEVVLDFLKNLQPKISAQIAKKVLLLNLEPIPTDSKELKGYKGLFRVDSGEYRIVGKAQKWVTKKSAPQLEGEWL